MILGYTALIHTSEYKKIKNKTYDILASMDKNSFRKEQNTKFYDHDGNVIGEINSGDYEYAEIADIPINLQNAYIATEDQRFKVHNGVDWIGTARASLSLVLHRGEITQGGSTITQQVIKNNLLSQEQTFARKFLEISIAPQLEKKYTKQEIMEFYCNSNYYGNGCYGVQSASRFYFGKDVNELSLAESAMLAGVSNSPNNYNPVTNEKAAIKRMKIVLNNMLNQKYITEKEYKQAISYEINVVQKNRALVSTGNYMCSYALDCAIRKIMDKNGFQFEYLFKDEDSYNNYWNKYNKMYNEISSEIMAGGYKIETSFDSDIQSSVQSIIDGDMSGYQEVANGKFVNQAATVIIDNNSGMIVAMVGGRGTTDEYNRGFISTRQPGSTIKPILVYAPALDSGLINPSTILNDTKVYAVDGDENSFSPENATKNFLGNMSVREALARSVNTIPFQLYKQIGIGTAMEYLKTMHFTSIDPSDYTSSTLPLGGFTNGVTVVDMAKAYATLENNGQYQDSDCITKITHEFNGVLYSNENLDVSQIYSADAAFMTTDMMEGVIKQPYGTAYGLNINNHIVAAKTGTTNEDRDSWMCGYSKYFTTAVWVGKDDNNPLSDTSVSKKIWSDIMNTLHTGKEIKDFSLPDSIQYKSVNTNGEYTDKTLSSNELDTSKPLYDRRPNGYEYYSTTVANKYQKQKKKKELETAVSNAEESVSSFENYKLDNIDAARQFKSVYSKAEAVVEAIPDTKTKASYRKRLSNRYKILNKSYKKTWISIIKETEEDEQQQNIHDNEVSAENDAIASEEKLHDLRIANMQWYINKLSERNYNTAVTQNLLSDAKSCLSNCVDYSEYSNLKSQLDSEEKRISLLPTSIPSSTPENNADITPSPDNYPDDSSTTQNGSTNNNDTANSTNGSNNDASKKEE